MAKKRLGHKTSFMTRLGKRFFRGAANVGHSVGGALGIKTKSTLDQLPEDWGSGFSPEEDMKHAELAKAHALDSSGASTFSKILQKMPEVHLPGGYQFCGPGTKFTERIARGDKGINHLDKACREHDRAYNTGNTEIMRKSDRILQDRAQQIFDNTSWFDNPKLKAASKFVATGFGAKKFFEDGADTAEKMLEQFKGMGRRITEESTSNDPIMMQTPFGDVRAGSFGGKSIGKA